MIGLPGPTHHYGGLSDDNRASSKNQGNTSRPREAAMQALTLARLLMSLGQMVGLLPPQIRPYMPELQKHFSGDDQSIIEQATQRAPQLLEAMSSSSAMWVANAATITPPHDNTDGTLHLTVANLHTNIHRRIEAMDTYLTLRDIFAKVPNMVVDLPLSADEGFRDEGAANHMRLAPHHATAGLNVFVYGTDDNPRDPTQARQTLAASQALTAKHQMQDNAAIFVKQNPLAIEQGIFHNDVIAVSNENFLLVHEEAYAMGSADIAYIEDSYRERTGEKLILRVVTRDELSIQEAIDSYFFNSQIVTLPSGDMAMIAPADAKEVHGGKAWELAKKIVAESCNPLRELRSIDLRQSMKNGGGPACLRLRVLLSDAQITALSAHNHVLLDEATLVKLESVITRTYPETFHSSQIHYDSYLACKEAVAEICKCLGIAHYNV